MAGCRMEWMGWMGLYWLVVDCNTVRRSILKGPDIIN